MSPTGEVVGTVDVGGYDHAFYWSAGAGRVDLPTYGGGNQSGAKSINAHGQIAGFSRVEVTAGGQTTQVAHAVVWSKDGECPLLAHCPERGPAMRTASTTWGRSWAAPSSRIESEPFPAYSRHAVFWDADGSMTDLGELSNRPMWDVQAINNSGVVLGHSLMDDGFRYWLRRPDGTYAYLDRLGEDYADAQDLNESGLVVGTCKLAPATYRAAVWNPDGTINCILDPLAGTSFSMGHAMNNPGWLSASPRSPRMAAS